MIQKSLTKTVAVSSTPFLAEILGILTILVTFNIPNDCESHLNFVYESLQRLPKYTEFLQVVTGL